MECTWHGDLTGVSVTKPSFFLRRSGVRSSARRDFAAGLCWPLRGGFWTIRQIAALPYRNVGQGLDAPVQILLVTSRETRRWVIPKGNLADTIVPHAAAAQEAEEEAGVRGAVCPMPLGSYRYRKRKGSGASLMADVDVFPLAVTEELADWKEKEQRERRWFIARRGGRRGRRAGPARPDPLVRLKRIQHGGPPQRRARTGRRKIEGRSDVRLVPTPAAQDRRLLRAVRSPCRRR